MSVLLPAAAVAAAAAASAAAADRLGSSPVAVVFLPFVLVASILVVALGVSLSAAPCRRLAVCGVRLLVCGCAALIGLGSASASALYNRASRLPHGVIEISGRVEHVRESGGSSSLLVQMTGARSESIETSARGRLRVVTDAAPQIVPGTVIRVTPAAGDRSWWSDSRGVRSVRASSVEVVRDSESLPEAARSGIAAQIDRVAGRSGPLLRALLLGDDSLVDPRVTLLFRRSGTIHLLALSGMHLAVIALLAGGGAGLLFGRRAAVIATLLAAGLYLALIGGRPGLVRAALLVALGTAVRASGRRPRLEELLALTFMVHLIVQPAEVSGVGFQLSYLSLAGIALIAPQMNSRLRAWVPGALLQPLSAGCAAQLATAPLLLAQFGAIYPMGVVATLVMGPLVLVLMTAGLVSVAVAASGVPFVEFVSVPVLETLGGVVEFLGGAFATSGGVHLEASGGNALVAILGVVAASAMGWGMWTSSRERLRTELRWTGLL